MGTGELDELHEAWRRLCLAMPGAWEDHPFGPDSTVFKVSGRDRTGGKMFALLMFHRGRLLLNLKCEPAIAEQQRLRHAQITPGYHMNKRHWNSIAPGLETPFLVELIEDSYDLVLERLPRRDRDFIAFQARAGGGGLD